MKHLLFLTVSAVALTIGSSAQAACVSALPNVTCSGTTVGGFTNNADNLVITVAPGASVGNAGGDAFRVRGNNVTLTNDGDISASGDGIDSNSVTTGLTVTNTGTITSDARGIDARDKSNVTVTNSGSIDADNGALDLGAMAMVTNSGTIRAAGDAVDTGNGATVVNSGLLESTADDSKIVDVGNMSTVTNSGTIQSDRDEVEGIETGSDTTIVNSGTIRVSDDALNPAERIIVLNSGIIEATATGDGIDIDSGTITNTATGRILSANSSGIDYDASTEAVSVIDNAGLIRGVVGVEVELGLGSDPANTVGQHVINRSGGTIEGTGGTALVLGAGADLVRLSGGSFLIGATDLGDDDDLLEFAGMDFATGSFTGLFDGGRGFDTASFEFSLASISQIALAGQTLTFSFLDKDALDGLRLTRFESFAFGGQTYSRSALLAAVPSTVPLPAGAWLLIGGMAGLVALRRRRIS